MNFKAVGFDRTGVIVGGTASTFNKTISEITGVTIEEFKTAYRKHNNSFNLGKITTEELWESVLNELNKISFLDKVLTLVNKPKEVNLDVLDIIKELGKKGIKVGLLSNDKPEAAKYMREVEHLDDLFDVMCVSSETGLTKPSKEAYLDFLSKLDIKPDKLVFIDDTQINLDTASELGITTILCTDHRNLKNQLKDLGVF